MKKLVIMAVLGVVTACASPQPLPPLEPPRYYYWNGAQPEATTQQFQQHLAGCTQEARQVQTLLGNRDLGTMYHIMARELEGCMAGHGWELRSEQAGHSGIPSIESTPTVRNRSALSYKQLRMQKETTKEVEAFALDPAHPYFGEVADEMVPLINQGLSLQEAYEKATVNCTSSTIGSETIKRCH